MPRERLVPLDGGSDFTTIRASMPCHSLKVYQDGTRDKSFVYKRKADGTEDGFSVEFTTQAGDPIVLLGAGRSGILGRPPSYDAKDVPVDTAATTGDSGCGDPILMIKASDDSTPNITIIESESEL